MARWLRVVAGGAFAGMAVGSILAGDISKGILIAAIGGLITSGERLTDLGRHIGRRLR
jgi:hypothetical protein